MAIIDLRSLVKPECDVVEFIGDADRLEYSLPIKKTIGMTLMLQNYLNDFGKDRDLTNNLVSDNIEVSFFTLYCWIKAYYSEMTLEWVKKNVDEELFVELMKIANDLFFPKTTEQAKPKKKPTAKKPTKKARRS